MTDKAVNSETGINPALFLRALSFSADKHRKGKRKDVDETPYILHPIAVATVLAVEGNVTDETLLIAALLHDTVEDTDVTREEIVGLFGEEVASIVMEVTNDEGWSKEEKKKQQAERMKTASDRAKQLKIVDKTCNIRDIMQIPPVDWSAEKRLEYLASAKLVVDNCRGINQELEAVFDSVLQDGEKILTESLCCCMKPPFDFSAIDSKDIGTDETSGRYGDVSLSTCKSCGNKWLRYFVEYEAFSRSGRWYMGVISEEAANNVTPETAVSVLQSLEWRIAGGSYYDSTGFKHTGAVNVGIY